MRIKFRIEKKKVVKCVYPEISIDTNDYPELKGLDSGQLRHRIAKYLDEMPATDNQYDSLWEQAKAGMKEFDMDPDNEELEVFIHLDDEDGPASDFSEDDIITP
ncbi:hypothetical protein FUAX_21160 [Fulvitalea axinellae]|uniref:Uncharacterized protein n=1 Tax=Fulvitalea axinellae TaxID=1182444 RepID=A0AAU9CTB5_9BACT|nr:hypothetical protein FUAX_21160 [Fulvitalea axinellae]